MKLADGRTLSDLCKVHTEEAIRAMIRIMRKKDASDAAVMAAVNSIFDRAYGRPRQETTVEMTVNTETAAALEAARKRARHVAEDVFADAERAPTVQ